MRCCSCCRRARPRSSRCRSGSTVDNHASSCCLLLARVGLHVSAPPPGGSHCTCELHTSPIEPFGPLVLILRVARRTLAACPTATEVPINASPAAETHGLGPPGPARLQVSGNRMAHETAALSGLSQCTQLQVGGWVPRWLPEPAVGSRSSR
jgi:hypothetical protein